MTDVFKRHGSIVRLGRGCRVHAERRFAGPEAVVACLSRYRHRVTVFNSRNLSLDEHCTMCLAGTAPLIFASRKAECSEADSCIRPDRKQTTNPYDREPSGTHCQLEPKFKRPVLSFQGALNNMARAAIVLQIAASKFKVRASLQTCIDASNQHFDPAVCDLRLGR